MADRVNNTVWGPLSEAVEQAGERAKEMNVHARELARAAVTEIRDRAVSLASERSEPVLKLVRTTAKDAREALVERVGEAREALAERVGGIELGQVAEQLGKRIEDVRQRVLPFEGAVRGRIEALLKGLNLALHGDVKELQKRLEEADKRLARLERQVAEVRRAA